MHRAISEYDSHGEGIEYGNGVCESDVDGNIPHSLWEHGDVHQMITYSRWIFEDELREMKSQSSRLVDRWEYYNICGYVQDVDQIWLFDYYNIELRS